MIFKSSSSSKKRDNPFTRRTLLMAGGQIGLMGLLTGRLFYLGGIRSEHYETLALENRIRLRLSLPERGRLLDRQGRPLADNKTSYRLVCYPGESQNLSEIVKATFSLSFMPVGSLEPYSMGEGDPEKKGAQEALLKALKGHPRFRPYILKENLTWEEICEIEVQTTHLPALTVEKGVKRFYPQSETFAHLIGYVQVPGPENSQVPGPLKLPDYRIGKKGVEKSFEERLQGTPGFKEVEVNARGLLIRELTKKPAVKGKDQVLSLELGLQKRAESLLKKHQSGSLVMLDIASGEVLSLVSNPSFNPNFFVDGISHKNWDALRDNPYAPLSNKAIQGLYAPGSLFKMIVGLAGLKAGVIDERKAVFCEGYVEISQHRYHCWRRHGHGKVTLQTALRESCDVYFYELARRVGIDRIQEMAYQLGLGHVTGIELLGEKAGLIPGREWKQRTQKQPWMVGDTVLSSIGQGAMLTTPLQLAVMMARLVGNGKVITPTLQKKGEESHFASLAIQSSHLNLMKKAMDEAVNHASGTIFRYRIQEKNFAMGGKSGTTQVRRISLQERKKRVRRNEELPWKLRDHALFAGYAPIHVPRFAICVSVEHGGGGSRIAGPIARDLLLYAQNSEALRS